MSRELGAPSLRLSSESLCISRVKDDADHLTSWYFATMTFVMARPRSEEAQQKVLDAAVALVAEAGVSGFTIDAVARRSGVAKTTIYRRWSSTDELLMAALDCTVEHLATPNTGALRTDLIALYTSVMTMLEQPHMFSTMLGSLARAANDPDFHRLVQELEQERHQPLRTVLQLAQARGELAVDADLDLMMEFCEGPMVARKIMRLSRYEPGEIEAMVDMVVRGLGATRPRPD